jgi:hypothetical protein
MKITSGTLTIGKDGKVLLYPTYLENHGYERAFGQILGSDVLWFKRNTEGCTLELTEYRHGDGYYDRSLQFQVKAYFQCSGGEWMQIAFYKITVEILMEKLPEIEQRIIQQFQQHAANISKEKLIEIVTMPESTEVECAFCPWTGAIANLNEHQKEEHPLPNDPFDDSLEN